jgi:5-formyltetrahydrofolate cyclo-ligase
VESWPEIRAWRKARRAALIARRVALTQLERARLGAIALERLAPLLPAPQGRTIGIYWPFKGEIDLRPLARRFAREGAVIGLPVVVEKARPLEFWRWVPGAPLGRGIWDIPIPAERAPVLPELLLVPLVGFDASGYRLGYGGGYYDRTLAALAPRPRAIGLGYELGRLATIHPQPHDIPMNAIVTEGGIVHQAEG